MTPTLQILSFILLSVPTAWEIWNDRKGDLNKSEDVFFRVLIIAVVSTVNVLLFDVPYFASLLLSLAIHFAFFDYIIAYILIKNGTIEPSRGIKLHWFTYVAKSGVVDNLKFWRNMRCGWRFAIRLTFLAVSLLIFFIS